MTDNEKNGYFGKEIRRIQEIEEELKQTMIKRYTDAQELDIIHNIKEL